MATKRDVEFTIRARNEAKAALDSIAASLRSLSGAQGTVTAGAPAVAGSLARLGNAARQTAAAGRQIGRNGLLGLQPHQLANLNFQLQDIFVSLQAGQAPLNVLIQQGSQISQIFSTGIPAAFLRFLGVVGLVVAAVAAVATVAGRAAERMAAVREATRDASGELDHAATRSSDWAEAFREVGLAWNDMIDAIADTPLVRSAVDAISRDLDQIARNFRSAIAQLRGATPEQVAAIQRGEDIRPKGDDPNARPSPEGLAETEAKRKADLTESLRLQEEADRVAARAAERAQEARADFQQHLSDLEFEATLIGQSAEQQEILTALRQAELEAQASGLELSQQEYAALHQRILLLQDARQKEADAAAAAAASAEAEGEIIAKKDRAAQDAARSVERLNERIAGGLTDAFEDAISGTESLGDAFRKFAAEFLREIAKMILQQAILNALKNSGFGGSVGVGGFHSGGIAGSATPQRRVSRSLFSDAARYHGGGFAGLRPGEVPAVLKRNEEVLTESDPRHAFNGGGERMPNIKIVNTFDPDEAASQLLGTRSGEQGVINIIGANRTTIRSILG